MSKDSIVKNIPVMCDGLIQLSCDLQEMRWARDYKPTLGIKLLSSNGEDLTEAQWKKLKAAGDDIFDRVRKARA